MPDHWTTGQQALFTRLFRHMSANPEVFRHPDAPQMDPDHWDTICHNAAWMAADMLEDDGTPYLHYDRRGKVIGREPSGQAQ